jgi:hypothetical protein
MANISPFHNFENLLIRCHIREMLPNAVNTRIFTLCSTLLLEPKRFMMSTAVKQTGIKTVNKLRISSGILRHVVWQIVTDVAEEFSDFVVRGYSSVYLNCLIQWFGQYSLSKRR